MASEGGCEGSSRVMVDWTLRQTTRNPAGMNRPAIVDVWMVPVQAGVWSTPDDMSNLNHLGHLRRCLRQYTEPGVRGPDLPISDRLVASRDDPA